jgi:hypothetical protein
MIRTLSILAVAACFAAPVAAQNSTVRTETITTVTIPASEYATWRAQGYSTQDIFYAYNTASGTKREVGEILTMRKNGQSWDQIAKTCGCEMNTVYGTPRSAVAGERMTLADTKTTSARKASVYPSYEMKMGKAFYNNANRLTPRDFHRLRTAGYTTDEVYMIANAAHETGLDTNYFAQAITRGMYARQISLEFGINPSRLTRVRPEWRTQEWASAVNEPVYTRERLNVWW